MRKIFGIVFLLASVGAFHVSAEQKKQQQNNIDILLLLALPGSGKSEVRRYLSSLTPQECVQQFGIKDTVQVDDYPYVHMMRRISDELRDRGHEGAYFISPALPFKNSKTWGALMHLINEDYDDLVNKRVYKNNSAAQWLFERMDVANKKVGIEPVFETMNPKLKRKLAKVLEKDARKLLNEKNKEAKKGCKNKTVVFEFARGGADASPMPLPGPYGYQYALSQLRSDILDKANILYVWVDPAESRRKNLARANPNDPGSILNHCVPQAVMYTDYGTDDIAWLLKSSDVKNAIAINAHGKKYHIPVGRFDNRVDKTTFAHKDHVLWHHDEITNLKTSLQSAFTDIQQGQRALKNV